MEIKYVAGKGIDKDRLKQIAITLIDKNYAQNIILDDKKLVIDSNFSPIALDCILNSVGFQVIRK